MNIINVFWAVAALLTGSLFSYLLWAFVAQAITLFAASGTLMYYMTYLGLILFTVFWVIVIPIYTALSEEDGGVFKKIISGKLGE